jgi:hypothetical protein
LVLVTGSTVTMLSDGDTQTSTGASPDNNRPSGDNLAARKVGLSNSFWRGIRERGAVIVTPGREARCPVWILPDCGGKDTESPTQQDRRVGSLSPEVLEPVRRQGSVDGRAGDERWPKLAKQSSTPSGALSPVGDRRRHPVYLLSFAIVSAFHAPRHDLVIRGRRDTGTPAPGASDIHL